MGGVKKMEFKINKAWNWVIIVFCISLSFAIPACINESEQPTPASYSTNKTTQPSTTTSNSSSTTTSNTSLNSTHTTIFPGATSGTATTQGTQYSTGITTWGAPVGNTTWGGNVREGNNKK
jgi:hypothetical protein